MNFKTKSGIMEAIGVICSSEMLVLQETEEDWIYFFSDKLSTDCFIYSSCRPYFMGWFKEGGF